MREWMPSSAVRRHAGGLVAWLAAAAMLAGCSGGTRLAGDTGDGEPDLDVAEDADRSPPEDDAGAADGTPAPVCGNGTVEPGEECDGDPPRDCTTVCGTAGTQACSGCSWSDCENGAAEWCNGIDDDCDGRTDEDFDLTTDPQNCGACGAACDPAHATGDCADATCRIVSCDPGWVDVNGSPIDGCEYFCTPTAARESEADGTCRNGLDDDCDGQSDCPDPDCECGCVPETCNRLDDDCDGLTDEDFDLDYDPRNCGDCGTVCPPAAHATAICVLGVCDLRCDSGWLDRDGDHANGCESPDFPPGPDPSETLCNGIDDDLDGMTDEDYLAYSCGLGVCVSDSVCFHAVETCVPGMPAAATDTTCDGLDDDCDGLTDEDTTCP
jgi:hypothetical protein